MDAGAVWAAIGVVCGAEAAVFAAILAFQQSQIGRLSREHRTCEERAEKSERQLTDYLIRLTEAEHRAREAEQTAANLKAVEEIRRARGGK